MESRAVLRQKVTNLVAIISADVKLRMEAMSDDNKRRIWLLSDAVSQHLSNEWNKTLFYIREGLDSEVRAMESFMKEVKVIISWELEALNSPENPVPTVEKLEQILRLVQEIINHPLTPPKERLLHERPEELKIPASALMSDDEKRVHGLMLY